ncbi:MAG: LysR family transcriptional regulator, partial [Asticcacaulis sp.]|nr:LysR family transcriptional regulator [Asticcacaulis sp.]
MLAPRRFLPALSHLQAFEAAARTGSVTQAARELNLTQSAVSRQIKSLEDQLEVELFHRERQTIRLTLGGEAYARDIRDALKRIATASS